MQHPKTLIPIYQQIATDIASKIANGYYLEGQKLYARSSLASQYNVSAETARRAISILSDMRIVDTTKGSGVIVASYKNALEFVRQYMDVTTINDLKNEIFESISNQEREIAMLKEHLSLLVDKAKRFKATSPFIPDQVEIREDMQYCGKTLSDIDFWHNTMATVIAIKRGEDLMMSPGPYAALHEQDTLYFVGDENCVERVLTFLYPKK